MRLIATDFSWSIWVFRITMDCLATAPKTAEAPPPSVLAASLTVTESPYLAPLGQMTSSLRIFSLEPEKTTSAPGLER